MRVSFIINARSGRRQQVESLRRLVTRDAARRGDEVSVHVTTSKHEVDAIFGAPAFDSVELVYAAGGDGTINEIGRRLVGSNRGFGVLPVGSGNGLARHLGIPLDPAAALALRDASTLTEVDVATINGVTFLGVCGIGFDAAIAHRFATAGSRGIRTYVREGIVSFFSYRPHVYEIELDGQHLTESAFVLTVANASQYGNDASIAPGASIRDGLLDLCILQQAPWLEIPAIVHRLFHGQLDRSARFSRWAGREIVIRRQASGPAHVDGEPIELPETLRISIIPRALRVLVPSVRIDSI